MLPLTVALNSQVALAQNDADADTPDEAASDGAVSDAQATDEPVSQKTKSSTYRLPPPESRWKTVGLGLGFAGVWYAGAWGLREWFWAQSPGAPELRYPIVGPWMDLYQTGCPSNDPDCSTFGLVARTVLVVIDGIGQVGGLAVALDGLFTPTGSHSAVQASRARPAAAPRLSPIPVPWSASGGGGLSFVGQF